jgi:hypothetical protein
MAVSELLFKDKSEVNLPAFADASPVVVGVSLGVLFVLIFV